MDLRATLILASTLAVLLAVFTACQNRDPLEWEAIQAAIRQRFPQARQLSTAELADWLAKPAPERPVLLDARQPEEYRVSHLPGALLTPDEGAALEALEGMPADRPVVVYCSVGWRSSELAEKLGKDGFRRVYNLEGSIFAWANEGRTVVRDGEPVRAVHPYDAHWGRLLDRELWATSPEEP